MEKAFYDPNGNSAFLSPANDSRVNMMLLLADRRPAGLELMPAGRSEGLVLFPWTTLKNRITGPDDPQSDDTVGRCQTNVSGADAFATAVTAARGLGSDEKAALIVARRALTECGTPQNQQSLPALVPASDAGRAFAIYLDGVRAFYRGDFSGAQGSFKELRSADEKWLRETSLYMVARTALNRAQSAMFDEYGSILPAKKRDQSAVAAADVAFENYLKAYPRGQYAGSARGLLRRVYWLAGDNVRLSAAYERTFRMSGTRSTAADLSLAQEIDHKLFDQGQSQARDEAHDINGSTLLAVDDLMRMRNGGDQECCTPISAAEIEGQRSRFGADVALFDYIRAAHAFFVRHDARAVLRLIPDASHQQRFSALQFSRQVLRGLALDATKDANARRFWVDLLPGAKGPYQNEAVQLAIATHDESHDALDRIFADGSPVTNPVIREVLLTYTAGPTLLRQQAQNSAVPQRERDVALYLLLSKGLQRGFYGEFGRDVRLVPASAPNDSNVNLNDGSADAVEDDAPIPLGVFARPATLGDFGCPALSSTVRALTARPDASTPRICLAEFFRTNGFDHFAYDLPLRSTGLAGTAPLFPGQPYSRQSVYQSIIADSGATPDERAYSLYRAIRCYAPSGINDCGGKDVDVGQRRAWFRQLKATYPNSRWAKSSDLYW